MSASIDSSCGPSTPNGMRSGCLDAIRTENSSARRGRATRRPRNPVPPKTVTVLPFMALVSRRGIPMQLAAAHEPPGDVGGLQLGAFRRRMRREIACDGDEDMPALIGIAPLAELPHAG